MGDPISTNDLLRRINQLERRVQYLEEGVIPLSVPLSSTPPSTTLPGVFEVTLENLEDVYRVNR